jgi:hypothetical protein
MMLWRMEVAASRRLFASPLSSPHQYFLFCVGEDGKMDMHVRRGVARLILQ